MSALPPPRATSAPAAARRSNARALLVAGVATAIGVILALSVWSAAVLTLERDEQPAGSLAAGQHQHAPVAEPASVHVAAHGVAADLIALGTGDDGRLQVPDDAHTAGWWRAGPDPGEPGAAVIVGHVDSRDGPGAFFGLADVDAGARVSVGRSDGSRVHFRVDRVETHPKDDFPTEAVYARTDAPTLRLITCAGAFDASERSYEDNVIVFADLEWDEAEAAGATAAPAGSG